MTTIVRHSLLCILFVSSCLLLGCGGCASTEMQSGSALPAAQEVEQSKPKKSESAEAVYLYLVFSRAMQQGHTPLMVTSLEKLKEFNPPVTVYVDAGIWALEHSAPSLLPSIKQGIAAHPQSVALHLLYAELLQKTGKTPEAIAHMQDFIAANPHEVDGKIELALLMAHEKNFSEAEAILQSISGEERSGLVDYYHAKALLGLKRKQEAQDYLEASVKKSPDFIDALNDLAFLYEQNNELKKARDTYEKILDDYGANYELVLRVILLSLRLKEVDKALEFFENSPMTPELTVTVASMFVSDGHYDVAEPILLGLADIEDAPQELYFYLAAIAYERDRDPHKSYEWLTYIDANHKDYPKALMLRVKLLIDGEQYEKALAETRLGQKLEPDNKEFQSTEIRILASQGNYVQALSILQDMEKNSPYDGELIYLRASILDQSGDKKNALKTMEALLQTEPEHVQALNYVGYTLAEQSKELKRAIGLLRKANALAPDNNYILDSLAWALFKAGERKEAWETIRKAVKAPGMPEPTIWEHYGDIARSLGNVDEAHKGYTKALEFAPNNADTIKYKQDQL